MIPWIKGLLKNRLTKSSAISLSATQQINVMITQITASCTNTKASVRSSSLFPIEDIATIRKKMVTASREYTLILSNLFITYPQLLTMQPAALT
jgi:hypothetical protein